MTTPADIQRNAKHILYLLVNEQNLRPGEGLMPPVLQHLLDRNQFSHDDQRLAIEFAREHGWLQFGPNEEIQLTEKGFALN